MASRASPESLARVAQAWPELLADLAAGELIAKIYEKHGLTRAPVEAYKLASPERITQWQGARAASASALEEQALETASNPKLDAGYARVRIDTLKWAAAKRNPDHYADRSKHDINVKTIDYTGILQRAEARLAARVAGQVIEGQVIRPELAILEDDDANPLF